MILRLFCEEFCRIKFLNMFNIFATTLRHLATHARKLRITGDCFETALRATRDVCRQLSQNSRSPVRGALSRTKAGPRVSETMNATGLSLATLFSVNHV